MSYLIDTDIYIYFLKGHPEISRKLLETNDSDIFISSISIAELYYGIFNSVEKERNLKLIKKNLEEIQVQNFNRHSAKIFGRLKAEIKKQGTPIADMDLAIAAIAIQNGHTLVTHNTKHFLPIRELILEDWSI